MKTFLVEKGILIALIIAAAPLVVFFLARGRIRFAVVAVALALVVLVVGSRTAQWASVGAMAGATIGGLGAWVWAVGARDVASENAVLAVLIGGFLGVLVGSISGAWLSERTIPAPPATP
jgi:hypothetical protein